MRKIIHNAARQNAALGTYTPSFFENGIRYDIYKPYSSTTQFSESIESVLCVDNNDLSPVQTERNYDMICNCHSCFANYAHTTNLCDRNNKLTM